MTDKLNIDGLEVDITQWNLGAGHQGQVHLGTLSNDPTTTVVVKFMPFDDKEWIRSQALCDLNLPALSPAFAAPIVAEDDGAGQIVHVSPYVEGVSWEDDVDRSLPQCLEMALQYASLMALLEEHGISHGDQDINNFRIAPDGEISLIDWDGYSSTDPTVPAPNTIGHWRMLAPELRNSTGITPNRESDRFAMAGIFSLLINNRFVTDGLAEDPAEVDDYMTRGYWPEKDRVLEPDELAISAIGPELQDLFDLGFSLDPQARPSPDTWRRALTRALHNCWIHDCGQAFVSDAGKTRCPGCGQTVEVQAATRSLKIEIQDSGARFSSEILERQPIILGRATMPDLPGTVSGQHLQITPHADRLLLRHVGRHDTLILSRGDWYCLDQHWVLQSEIVTNAVFIKLATTLISIKIE